MRPEVADDLGPHMILRISVLLTPEECQDFHTRLINPDINVDDELNKLSLENNRLKRRKREIVTPEQCVQVLQEWLDDQGESMYWDRLSRTLRLIGREDVARELGKNLNQDKNLDMKKNVQDYSKKSQHAHSSLLMKEEELPEEAARKARDISDQDWADWDDWDLIIEAETARPYERSISGWCKPVVQGIIMGFLGSGLLAIVVAYFTIWLANQDCVQIVRSQHISDFQEA
ncbi:transmembrane and death domain protein 1 isoform X2 [Ambystoma mexicanum]|uniref:transmembrane and death domain protein 1 isoform X2 n=1 Tax=Ambystoma mexicanum TaxID=8296 RepID=UPI0037E740C7